MKSETIGPNGEATIYLGDCLEILPTLTGVDAVVTDPPYGIGAAKMTLGNGKKQFDRAGGAWDNMKPDISEIMTAAPLQIIWGGNYFSDVLPPTNDWLVWDKAQPDSVSFSGAELAWSNVGRNARVKRHHWGREDKQHPTMKPIAVMEWCLGFIPDATTILDPFMGSGTTGVACANLGRRFIGIEIEPKYYDIARKRISDAYDQGRLFTEEKPEPKQEVLL
jgi:site-specific DNA-methyltransferase (adenine-specific)